jgi:hypothetical protein
MLTRPRSERRDRSSSEGPKMSDQSGGPRVSASPPRPSAVEIQQVQQQHAVTAALRGGVPQAYFNSFAVVQTAADLSLVLMSNGNPVLTVSMSYITAKSLVPDMQRAITTFEEATKQTIKTINEVTPDLNKQLKATDAQSS